MSDTQEHPGPKAREASRSVLACALAGGVAVVLHVLQLWSVDLFGQRWPWAVRWPHNFHLWLLEGVAWLVVVATLIARRYADQARQWWLRLAPLAKALTLAALLFAIELFFAIGFWLTWPHGVDELGWLRSFFYVGSEHRPAALFSSLQLGLAGWLAWRCYLHERHAAWLVGAVLCWYLGLDEWFSIHEFIGIAARQFDGLVAARAALQAHGLIVYGWQLVFLPVVMVVGPLLLRAFWRITSRGELVCLVAGTAVFLGGALGFESAEARGTSTDAAWWASARAHATLLAEELMEMLGVTIVVGVFARRWFAGGGAGVVDGASLAAKETGWTVPQQRGPC
jgi:hypothetical protein